MRDKAKSWVSQRAALGFVVLGFVHLACKSEPPAKDEPASDTSAPARAVATPSAAAVEARGATRSTAKCPAGRWSYDYSDHALETLMKNVAGAKVVKEEGSFICTVSEGTHGTLVCETQGKAVENVVETNQAGMKMVISVTIDGKATMQYTLIDAKRMKVVSSDTSTLKIATEVNLGGKSIPFPADKVISIFGKPESMLGYKCEDGKLYLQPQIDNVESPWQRLDPVE